VLRLLRVELLNSEIFASLHEAKTFAASWRHESPDEPLYS
jgi:hypothetical protein